MKNFWIYFTASVVSLIGANFFIFNQAWYLLKLTGERVSVGLTWSLFFLPALIFLPMFGKLYDSVDLKKLIVSLEVAKLLVLALFSVALSYFPSKELTYLLACTFGLLFCPYFSSVYVIVKRLVPMEFQSKYSYIVEASLQIANITALSLSGFLFERLGFPKLLALSSLLIGLGALLMNKMSFESKSVQKLNRELIFTGYKNIYSLIKNPLGNQALSYKELLYGILHTIPQCLISVANVPLTLYVFTVMRKGPTEFGFADALLGLGALSASLIWARAHKLGQQKFVVVGIPAAAALSIVGLCLVPSTGLFPYIWMLIFGFGVSSSKIIARATVVRIVPSDQMGKYSTFFQTIGSLFMMFLLSMMSAFSGQVNVNVLFSILGGVSLLMTLLLIPLFYAKVDTRIPKYASYEIAK